MSSRLDRLFILLETGSTQAIRRAAANQLGEVNMKQEIFYKNIFLIFIYLFVYFVFCPGSEKSSSRVVVSVEEVGEVFVSQHLGDQTSSLTSSGGHPQPCSSLETSAG